MTKRVYDFDDSIVKNRRWSPKILWGTLALSIIGTLIILGVNDVQSKISSKLDEKRYESEMKYLNQKIDLQYHVLERGQEKIFIKLEQLEKLTNKKQQIQNP